MGDVDRGEPALRVERGTATEEELAALAVVLLALRARPAPGRPTARPARGPRGWGRGC
ncbi:acyl-CoA carboxylase epsilon subunit, partial [Streptomyces sp. NPDC059371]|uniref:acyl-CoA carboxylase epsilon subunit n=1 Tax=Streptomyces sp. NPDC059371 TaxID=3346812 RepID=UPI0036B53614